MESLNFIVVENTKVGGRVVCHMVMELSLIIVMSTLGNLSLVFNSDMVFSSSFFEIEKKIKKTKIFFCF